MWKFLILHPCGLLLFWLWMGSKMIHLARKKHQQRIYWWQYCDVCKWIPVSLQLSPRSPIEWLVFLLSANIYDVQGKSSETTPVLLGPLLLHRLVATTLDVSCNHCHRGLSPREFKNEHRKCFPSRTLLNFLMPARGRMNRNGFINLHRHGMILRISYGPSKEFIVHV